jgi:ABC-type multidrug transport system fused ATPase/permease subunit
MALRQTVSKYKYSIAVLLLFVLVENIAWIIEPTFFGKLLDALIGHFYDHERINFILPLFIWIFVYLINVIGGSLHRLFNGGTYSKMYTDVATNVINESKSRGDGYAEIHREAQSYTEKSHSDSTL